MLRRDGRAATCSLTRRASRSMSMDPSVLQRMIF
jgi:hypothetical protein